MNINYELTKQDYIDFNMEHMSSSTIAKRSLFIQTYIIPMVFLIVPIFTDKPFGYWGIIFLLWVNFYPKYFKKSTRKKVSKLIDEGKNEDMLGERSLSLNQNGIVDISKLSESKTSWSTVEKIAQTENHIFIYVSSVNAYIIPTRAFENANQKNEFINMVKANMCEKK